MTNGDALTRDSAYGTGFAVAAMASAALYIFTGLTGSLIALAICLPLAAYFAIDYWRIERRMEREVNEEMRRLG